MKIYVRIVHCPNERYQDVRGQVHHRGQSIDIAPASGQEGIDISSRCGVPRFWPFFANM